MGDIVVIGAGAVGLGCAYELRRRGHEVTVLDRARPGAGCSAGNLGWVVPSFSAPLPAPGLTRTALKWMVRPDSPLHISPFAVPRLAGFLWRFRRYCSARHHGAGLEALAALNGRTMELFDAWRADSVPFEMHQAGLLFAYLDASLVSETQRELEPLARHGYPVPEALTGDEARGLEPGLSDAVVAGLHARQERHVRPESLTAGLLQRLTDLGGEVHPDVTVEGVSLRGGRITSLRTSRGTLDGRRFILAAGASTGSLARTAGVRLPLQAGKGYSLTSPNPPIRLRHPIYMVGTKVGATSYDGALRIGGTMEFSGINERLDRRRLAGLRRSAERYLRALPDWGQATEWVGMRPLAPDGLPLIGRLPGVDNGWVATGHAMLGITLAPATAVLLADLMECGGSWLDARPFDPARFR